MSFSNARPNRVVVSDCHAQVEALRPYCDQEAARRFCVRCLHPAPKDLARHAHMHECGSRLSTAESRGRASRNLTLSVSANLVFEKR